MIPTGPWLGPAIVAALLVVTLAAVAEWSLRRAGHRPSYVDDPTLWALQRRAVRGDSRVIALIGSSRMLLAVSREILEEELPGFRAAQLAIDGTSGIGALENLAADDEFRGVVVLDLAEWDVTPAAWSSQERWLEAAGQLWRSPGALANAWLRANTRQHLTVLGQDGRNVLVSAVNMKWPEERWVIARSDRFRAADYARATKKRLRAKRAKNLSWVPTSAPPPPIWLGEIVRLENAISRIQARGGKVVLFRLPTSGEHWRRGDAVFPRALYWDRLATATTATTVHFKDVPALAEIDCPDEAHLGQRDQERFTKALAEVLRKRGAVTR